MPILAELARGVETDSAEGTAALGARLAAALPPDSILALQGDLGAGKTTLTQAMARAWGIEAVVKSPTFNLVSVYPGKRQLIHVDAYRLEDPEAVENLMLEELVEPPYTIVVEWPERIASWFPEDAFWIQIAIDGESRRYFRLREPSASEA